ncbi:hypothetical protein Rhopal_004826-T1 [Rhodotorula paludigena]|uniref:TauD/TfdA-like domain-containing protein n=1 Tax=Rhodotorula paludigena TaxID=86838 RepID=A0AAV5GNP3_9BASI|nr:hypothetical protein Rhopal_004826-T1 [Rhodotorula paludigena]
MPAAAAPVSSARDVPLHSLKQSKAVAGSAPFLEGHAPFQHTLPVEVFGEAAFPGVYHLSQPTVDLDVALATLSTWAESGELKKQLVAHGGALLLRGLPLPTPHEFSQAMFASKVGTVPHVEVGRPPKRTVLAPAVSTANEGPAWAPIWTHSEYGWSSVHPAYIAFFGWVPAQVGGETPINSGVEVAARLKAQAPRFFKALSEKGILYSYRYTVANVDTSNSGSSILTAYGQDVRPEDDAETVRAKVEQEIRKHSDRFTFHDDGSLTVWHRVPVIRTHHKTGASTFFGNLISAYARAKHHGALEPPYLGDDGGYHPIPYYGDGTTIDVADLEIANQIIEETKADVKWQQGDVLILDNHIALHSRVPWEGERRILASLWDGEKFPDAQNPWGEHKWEALESGRVQ